LKESLELKPEQNLDAEDEQTGLVECRLDLAIQFFRHDFRNSPIPGELRLRLQR
jgi:hypothetical protein